MTNVRQLMKYPVVTIVVPAYNTEATISETLVSLVQQDYPALEVIVVDDGSKDRTSEIAEREAARANGKIRCVRQENAGQATALNNGWREAKGDYIGYLSADDVIYPTAISELVAFLETHSELAGVYPDYDLIDANSQKIRFVAAPDFDAKQLVEHSVCQPGPGAIFRKSAYEKTGGWNPALRLTPDFDFWLRLSRYGKLARLPRSLAGFRVHESSQSFAPPSEAKSEELPNVVAEFLKGGGDWNQARALAWAHVLSARLHLRGGRWMRAVSHLRTALLNELGIIFRIRFWHLLASGALGRVRYQVQSATRPHKH